MVLLRTFHLLITQGFRPLGLFPVHELTEKRRQALAIRYDHVRYFLSEPRDVVEPASYELFIKRKGLSPIPDPLRDVTDRLLGSSSPTWSLFDRVPPSDLEDTIAQAKVANSSVLPLEGIHDYDCLSLPRSFNKKCGCQRQQEKGYTVFVRNIR